MIHIMPQILNKISIRSHEHEILSWSVLEIQFRIRGWKMIVKCYLDLGNTISICEILFRIPGRLENMIVRFHLDLGNSLSNSRLENMIWNSISTWEILFRILAGKYDHEILSRFGKCYFELDSFKTQFYGHFTYGRDEFRQKNRLTWLQLACIWSK